MGGPKGGEDLPHRVLPLFFSYKSCIFNLSFFLCPQKAQRRVFYFSPHIKRLAKEDEMETKQARFGALDPVQQKIAKLTSHMMHLHYCENDIEGLIALFDEPFSWLGAGEAEYAVGKERVCSIFRQFVGKVPKCSISDEEYDVITVAPGVHLCTGRLWITTDPESHMYLRVHQRVAALFRMAEGGARCCHIHVSNPYSEMTESEMGFPMQMGRHTYEYLQEVIGEQKKQIEAQTLQLERMSFEDALTGLYNRNKFNELLDEQGGKSLCALGVACFDINGLKSVNDRLGHTAGDELIRRTAKHLHCAFPGRAFRIGGDEFVAICEGMAEGEFYAGVTQARDGMEKEGISCSAGACWQATECSIREQLDVADERMYREKKWFYRTKSVGRE